MLKVLSWQKSWMLVPSKDISSVYPKFILGTSVVWIKKYFWREIEHNTLFLYNLESSEVVDKNPLKAISCGIIKRWVLS